MSTHSRIPALDGVRGLAIVLVMAHHFTWLNEGSGLVRAWSELMHLGSFGVDLFFVLSGFLITGILLENIGKPGCFRNFFLRRVLRIFPLYYVFVVFSLWILPGLAASFLPEDSFAGFSQAAGNWPWYVFYLSNVLVALKDSFAPGGIDITWSLAVEEHFYLFWPFLAAAAGARGMKKVCAVILAAVVLLRAAAWLNHAGWISLYVLTPFRMDSLAAGGLLAALMHEGRQADRLIRRVCGAAAVVVLIAAAAGRLNQADVFVMLPGYTLVALAFAGLIHTVILAPEKSRCKRFFSHRFLVLMGRYSYAAYLVHIPVAAVVKVVMEKTVSGLPSEILQFIFYPAATAAVLPICFLSWHVIEKPFLSLKRFFPMSGAARAVSETSPGRDGA